MAERNKVSTHTGDLIVKGRISCKEIALPPSCVDNDAISATAAIDATKVDHQYAKTFGQNGTAATYRGVIHTAYGADGEVIEFIAGCRTVCIGDSTITIDLRKNGSSILSSVITLDSGDSNYTSVVGTVTTDDYVADDVFEIVVTATVGTGTLGVGLFVNALFREKAY